MWQNDSMELDRSDWRSGHAHVDEALGDMLRRLRKERGLTLENVASSFCDVSQLAKVERRERIPTVTFLGKLITRYDTLNRPLTVGQEHDIYRAGSRAER